MGLCWVPPRLGEEEDTSSTFLGLLIPSGAARMEPKGDKCRGGARKSVQGTQSEGGLAGDSRRAGFTNEEALEGSLEDYS